MKTHRMTRRDPHYLMVALHGLRGCTRSPPRQVCRVAGFRLRVQTGSDMQQTSSQATASDDIRTSVVTHSSSAQKAPLVRRGLTDTHTGTPAFLETWPTTAKPPSSLTTSTALTPWGQAQGSWAPHLPLDTQSPGQGVPKREGSW